MNEFIQLMKNRLVMGAFRYGTFATRPNYDNLGYLKHKVRLYRNTGNLEFMVDVANMALLAYTFPSVDRPTVFELLRRRLLATVDYEQLPSRDILYQTQWNPEFERLMRNRAKGTMFYWFNINRPTKPQLVDIAVSAFWEFTYPTHPQAHWHAVDGQQQGSW